MTLASMQMPSGAAHHAQIMARLADTGMLCMASCGGRSCCAEQYSEPAQVEQGANVLLDAVVVLAGSLLP